jgi:predicted ribosome quality control (RQC) complex YloA/Tae2 family protein
MRSGDEPADDERLAAREAFARALARALSRIERRVAAIEGDLAKARAAGALAERAQLFVPSAASAARGARALIAVDWTTGEAVPIELPIDPSKGAPEQLATVFRRARRLREGSAIAQRRLAAAVATLAKLRELAVLMADSDTDLEDLEIRARAAAPRDFARAVATADVLPARSRGKALPRPPYRKFVGAAGRVILVGRDAARNDELTLHVARPRDLWLHAKNWTGAHVVVPLDKGASCPSEVLVQAAHLAVHFSEARTESVVEVSYAARRFVRKPRGSAPGAVVVDREKVLVLRVEDALVTRLLETEVELV